MKLRLNVFDPKKLVEEAKEIIRKKGKKTGFLFIVWELTEHFGIPAIVALCGHEIIASVLATLPVGELVFYPVVGKLLKIW